MTHLSTPSENGEETEKVQRKAKPKSRPIKTTIGNNQHQQILPQGSKLAEPLGPVEPVEPALPSQPVEIEIETLDIIRKRQKS
ncbi:hypothetical protein J4Q44_G00260790 [Coregonus suidteri]|uniref:Uncharacterized protein n=1 Tax=Coregonus suidteri TaxID=861788 RepID=A0AAN8LCR6_9TELE